MSSPSPDPVTGNRAPAVTERAMGSLVLCPKCNIEMRLYGFELGNGSRDRYTFQCTNCRHLDVRRIRLR
jgi:hypothetical protein